MKKILMVLPLVAIATGAAALGLSSAQPHHYAVLQDSDCALVTPGELSQVIQVFSRRCVCTRLSVVPD